MTMKRLRSAALVLMFLASTVPAGFAAEASSSDVDARIAALEKQLEAVRVELDALKRTAATTASAATTAHTATPTATIMATETHTAAGTHTRTAAAEHTSEASEAANPMAAINSVLGGVTLTAAADVYYGYNANHPAGGTVTEPFQSNNNQFALNLISFQLDKAPKKSDPLGFRFSMGFGQAMNVVNGTDPAGLGFAQYFKEGYLSYLIPVGKGLQLDVGKFVTPAGAEVIETSENWNYSRGLLFYYAVPFYHFGARAKYTFNDKLSITGFAVNGWNSLVDNNTGKTGGASVAWHVTKKLSITETYLGGPEQTSYNGSSRHLTDTVVAFNPNSKLSLQANFDYGRENMLVTTRKPVDWSGIAGYARYAFNPKLAVAARYEYLTTMTDLPRAKLST